ncbi:MAG: molybdate ABC transporter substrate-binding protein [Herminiimonas sp.]|nr:molybdate ABC transporter substrate-binding protein [Herminiimonas sp.]
MRSNRSMYRVVFASLAIGMAAAAGAAEVRVAAAANFTAPLKKIAAAFTAATGHTVVASYGATGMLYAQIANGAPFDVLLAADEVVPAKLEKDGLAVPGTRFTYAIGRLILWSARPGLVDGQGEVLKKGAFDHLAIANPVTAPYGAAAVSTLRSLGLYEVNLPKLIQGENITQTFQFAQTGNVPLAFVAMSQVFEDGALKTGSAWVVPADRYSPIRQDAVVLAKGRSKPAVDAFVAFLKGSQARAVIGSYGYGF